MYQLKGFISIAALTDNTVGNVSPFGELSLWSQTYTRDRGEYETAGVPGFKLSSIFSVDSEIGKVSLDVGLANRVLVLAKWIYDYFQSTTELITPSDFAEQVRTYFVDEISYFNFGDFVTHNDITLPEWVSYRNENFPANDIKIWFSDIAFSNQFEETEIVPIVPLDNLDDFFLYPTNVKTLIESRTPTQMMDLIQAAKNKNPETIIRTLTIAYVNPNFPDFTFNTSWSVLIYGAAGNNLDSIRDAIIKYVLANSTHSKAQWGVILPDLFKRTEFILLPNWHTYAIPNKTVQAGIYSCVTTPALANVYAKTIIKEYTPEHILANIVHFSHPYKALAINCIPGPDNQFGKTQFLEVFPDFVNVNTSSTDFNRMSLNTQNWMLLLERLLLTAETMTEYTSLPDGINRVTRSGFIFASVNFQNIQYLVGAKYNLNLLSKYVADGYVVDGMILKYLPMN